MNSHKFCLSSNIFISFSFFILVKHILHKMYHFNYFKVYHLVVLSIFIMFGNQHQYFQNFYHPKQKHCTHETALHSFLSELLVISILLSVSMNLLILDTSFLKKCLKSFAHFFNCVVSLLLSFRSSLYILFINSLFDRWCTNIFSHSVGCLFHSLHSALWYTTILVLIKSNLPIWSFVTCAFVSYS